MRGIRGPATTLAPGQRPDDYFGRLIKYIPGEVVALYIGATGVVPATHPSRLSYLWVIFGFCVVATFVYMFLTARDETTKKPIWLQVVLATIGFPIWAYAMGGPFASLSWYDTLAGSLLLMATTFIFGLFKR